MRSIAIKPRISISDHVLFGAAVVSAALTMVYCVAKIEMAIDGDIGMPGIPLANPEKSRTLELVWLRQLANATVGFGAAVLALSTLLSIPSRTVRMVITGALWIGFAFIAAGAGGITLRTVGLVDSQGAIPLTWASAITNAAGVSLIVSWLAMTMLFSRRLVRSL